MSVFKYNEDKLFEEILDYIRNTYEQHYVGQHAGENVQVFDLLASNGMAESFARGNVIKYIARYGKKGGRNRDDIIKAIHYLLMLLYVHDKENEDIETTGITNEGVVNRYGFPPTGIGRLSPSKDEVGVPSSAENDKPFAFTGGPDPDPDNIVTKPKDIEVSSDGGEWDEVTQRNVERTFGKPRDSGRLEFGGQRTPYGYCTEGSPDPDPPRFPDKEVPSKLRDHENS